MGYKNRIRTEAINQHNKMQKFNEAIKRDRLRLNAYDKTTDIYKNLAAAIDEKENSYKANARAAVQAVYNTFVNEINERYALKGEELTEDVKVFETMKLKLPDIEKFMVKYKDNMSMLRYIVEYADDHGIVLPREYSDMYILPEIKIKAAEQLCSYCTLAVENDLYFNTVIDNDENFDKVTAGYVLQDD